MRIEEFLQAVIAHREVRRNPDGRMVAALAGPDGEVQQALRHSGFDSNFRNAGSRRRMDFQIAHERLQIRLRALEVNLHAVLAVQNPTGQRVLAGQAVDERAKADPLHDSADSNGTGAGHSFSASIIQL